MTDPLAHLYAETGAGDFDDDVELTVRETSLEELTNVAAEEELLSDQDVAELALLLKTKLVDGEVPNLELCDLGLADWTQGFRPAPPHDADVTLTAAGRQVVRFMLENDFPEIGFARG